MGTITNIDGEYKLETRRNGGDTRVLRSGVYQ